MTTQHTPTPTQQFLAILNEMRQATNAARLRTGDNAVSVQVEKGRFQVTRVTFDAKGISTVVPITPWATREETLAALAKVTK